MKNHHVASNLSVLVVPSLFLAISPLFASCDRKDLDNQNGAPGKITPQEQASAGYTLAEVSAHNTTSDCWIVIDGNVYNVTEFIRSHPGGASAISRRCGTDASSAFANVGHSNRAMNLRENYLIGVLKTEQGGALAPVVTATPGGVATPEPTSVPVRQFTWEEVGRHSQKSDCWIVIEKGVYDITNFFVDHPGGNAPVRFCGKDATNAFSFHSAEARDFKEKFHIGNLAP